MSGDEHADFPAPGSNVPGAPPPLRRRLTDADGVAVTERSRDETESASRPSHQQNTPRNTAGVRQSAVLSAIALGSVAIGLELARLLGGKHIQRQGNETSDRMPA